MLEGVLWKIYENRRGKMYINMNVLVSLQSLRGRAVGDLNLLINIIGSMVPFSGTQDS